MRFQFGDFIVDADARRLLRGDVDLHVAPKVFDLLVALVRERPRVLAKADLHARLWPDTFVSDASLAMLVAALRDALGESAREPHWVRTVHRHGYAFQGMAEEMVEIRATAGDTTGHSSTCWLVTPSGQVPLREGENLVGRDPGAAVRIDSPSISRRHACIRVEGGRATLEDLGSKNGTRARDTRITTVTPLAEGDELRFGSVETTFRTWAADPTRTEGDS